MFAELRDLDDQALVAAIIELYASGVQRDVRALCRALAGREVEVAVPGGSVRVDLGEWTSILIVRLGAWEPHLLGLVRSLVQPGAVAVDIGAHIGTWTLLLASLVGETGRVIACEPHAPSAARLRRIAGARVRVLETAIGERTGTAQLHGDGDPMLRSLVGAGAGVDVPITTLDALGLDRVDLVKIDTEGLELAVLRGGRALLGRSDPVLIVELHAEQLATQGASPDDVYAELRAQGFAIFDLCPIGCMLVVDPLRDSSGPTTNHILARRDPTPFAVPLR